MCRQVRQCQPSFWVQTLYRGCVNFGYELEKWFQSLVNILVSNIKVWIAALVHWPFAMSNKTELKQQEEKSNCFYLCVSILSFAVSAFLIYLMSLPLGHHHQHHQTGEEQINATEWANSQWWGNKLSKIYKLVNDWTGIKRFGKP